MTEKKKVKGGSRKGFPFEREVCKKLSLWWAGREDVFTRLGGSGGRATRRFRDGKPTAYSYGDIGFNDPIGEPLIKEYTFELKRGYSSTIDALSLVDYKSSSHSGKKPLLAEFWLKLCDLAEKNGTKPVLIFKRDRKEICMMIKSHNKIWSMINDSIFIPTIPPMEEVPTKYIYTNIGGDSVLIFLFEDFLKLESALFRPPLDIGISYPTPIGGIKGYEPSKIEIDSKEVPFTTKDKKFKVTIRHHPKKKKRTKIVL